MAQQTVDTRQATDEQIGALTNSKLRSTLDLSLANVQVSQAKLLVLDAQNALASAMANLNAILGSDADTRYELVDETPASPQAAPSNAEDLVQLAFRARPDLLALQDRSLAAKQFSSAEHDLVRPTISALAVAGGAPVRADQILSAGMVRREPTSASLSSMALNTPHAPKRRTFAPMPRKNKYAIFAITSGVMSVRRFSTHR